MTLQVKKCMTDKKMNFEYYMLKCMSNILVTVCSKSYDGVEQTKDHQKKNKFNRRSGFDPGRDIEE